MATCDIAHRHLHQPGMAVGAAAFIGHPVGPQIAFFEHMHRQSARPGRGNRLGMDGPGVPVKHDVGDVLFVQCSGEMCGPVRQPAQMRNKAPAGPEVLVTLVEPDAPDLRAGCFQCPRKQAKKGAMRPLQEQKVAAVSLGRQGHGAGPDLEVSPMYRAGGRFGQGEGTACAKTCCTSDSASDGEAGLVTGARGRYLGIHSRTQGGGHVHRHRDGYGRGHRAGPAG